MLTILMTLALPMRCSATMHSPVLQYPAALACWIAALRISSVVSVSVVYGEKLTLKAARHMLVTRAGLSAIRGRWGWLMLNM